MSVTNVPEYGLEHLLTREWLCTNGVGGYASSTVIGLNTRKYHGLLVASMSAPVRRMVILSRVEEQVIVGNRVVPLSSSEYPGVIHPAGHERLRCFSNEPFPRWAYQGDGWTIQKELHLLRGGNTVVLTYTLLCGDCKVDLQIRPLMALRGMHELMFQWNARLDAVEDEKDARLLRIPATARTPEAFIAHDGAFEKFGDWYLSTIYRRERERGYSGLEDLWTPGVLRWTLTPGRSVHVVCSTEPIDLDQCIAQSQTDAADAPEAVPAPIVIGTEHDHALATLFRAAEQFVAGSDLLSGFHWPAPAVRDQLIAMPGLLLVTKRFAQARHILLKLTNWIQRGLLPSRWPEDGTAAPYDGADISLWYIHAIYHYLRYSGDEQTVQQSLLEPMVRIIRSYEAGTDLGISLDADSLLLTHSPGKPTTWMDAKVGDWVITPRQGRPVELNALWYSALRIAAELCERFDRSTWAKDFQTRAATVQHGFNHRFWNAAADCCFDVVTNHGADASVRPNQIFAISLPYPVLATDCFLPVIDDIRQMLLTPFGLRTLAPNDPSYQGRYRGDVVSRDRAYHQGSVYPWLLGAYVSAVVKAMGRTREVRRHALDVLQPCLDWMRDQGMGQMRELFDGNPPHEPGGCIASAIAVGELLRCYVEDVLDQRPEVLKPIAKPANDPLLDSLDQPVPSQRG